MTIKPGAIHLAAREAPAAESRCALRPTRPRRVRLSVGRVDVRQWDRVEIGLVHAAIVRGREVRFQSGRESAEIASPSSSDRSRFQSLACGPQDSNLQPRDSRAPAFPRGLDYLTLPRDRPDSPERFRAVE